MLVDYISTEKLPDVITWLDWYFYSCKLSLLICVAIANLYYYLEIPCTTMGGVINASFVGFCLWTVYIALVKGFTVGQGEKK